MVFSSMFFVFTFLVLNLLSQILLKGTKKRNIAMLAFSLVFYSWGGPRYLILLLLMVLICWIGAILIEREARRPVKYSGGAMKDGSRIYLIVTVALCLAILGVFKYTGFLLTTFQNIFGIPQIIPQIALPIGISFYTFQLISYVVDVYRGEVEAQKKYWLLLLYASLFHQCIAGPIVRYQDVRDDILKRKTSLKEISQGVSRFSVGLAKKALLANGCAMVADTFLEGTAAELSAVPVLGIILGIAAFTLQIYLDFSAYSDMAIGMGLMCGFHYKENFNYPYIADSIAEFWRRWHISLATFFRDYVYIPLGGNRCTKGRQILNLMIVWGLTGLWHGANWNFVLWGLYFGVLLALERFVFADAVRRIPRLFRHVLTLVLVIFGMLIFKFTDMGNMGAALGSLFGLHGNGLTGAAVTMTFRNNLFFLIFCVIASTPLGVYVRRIFRNLTRRSTALYWIDGAWEVLHPVILIVISAYALAGDSYNPFLYFRF